MRNGVERPAHLFARPPQIFFLGVAETKIHVSDRLVPPPSAERCHDDAFIEKYSRVRVDELSDEPEGNAANASLGRSRRKRIAPSTSAPRSLVVPLGPEVEVAAGSAPARWPRQRR